MARLHKLFELIKIRDTEVKNHIYMAVFRGGAGYGGNDIVNERLINYYVERVRGSCGLIVIGGCFQLLIFT